LVVQSNQAPEKTPLPFGIVTPGTKYFHPNTGEFDEVSTLVAHMKRKEKKNKI
jgi:hypothetical protein